MPSSAVSTAMADAMPTAVSSVRRGARARFRTGRRRKVLAGRRGARHHRMRTRRVRWAGRMASMGRTRTARHTG